MFDVKETNASLRARMALPPMPPMLNEFRETIVHLTITIDRNQTVSQLKQFLATKVGATEHHLRLYALDPKGKLVCVFAHTRFFFFELITFSSSSNLSPLSRIPRRTAAAAAARDAEPRSRYGPARYVLLLRAHTSDCAVAAGAPWPGRFNGTWV